MTDPKYPSLKLPQFSFRIEEELLKGIEDYCEKNGLSKTEFARKACEQMLARVSETNAQLASNVVTQDQFESTIKQITSKLETPLDTVPRQDFDSLARKVEQLASKLAQLGEVAA